MKKLKTNEFILSFLGYILKSISNEERVSLEDITFDTEDERSLMSALIGQQEIRWIELLKGFAHKGWTISQRRHYMMTGKQSKMYSEKRWKRMFLTILTDYSNDCWKHRNEVLHGDTTEEGEKLKGRDWWIK